MATILVFRRAAEPAPRVTELKEGALGEIIIFPGVRIERRTSEGAPGTVTTSRKGSQRARKKQR